MQVNLNQVIQVKKWILNEKVVFFAGNLLVLKRAQSEVIDAR